MHVPAFLALQRADNLAEHRIAEAYRLYLALGDKPEIGFILSRPAELWLGVQTREVCRPGHAELATGLESSSGVTPCRAIFARARREACRVRPWQFEAP